MVEKHTWTEISSAPQGDDVYTTYLVDSYNHTGYAQTLEEWTVNGSNITSITYTIGDDVISQTKSTSADGVRTGVTEVVNSDTTTISWTYDALNRLTGEDYDAPNDFTHVYVYDIVGNREYRTVVAGATVETDYVYNDNDQLESEEHTTPGTAIPYNGDRVYAYANSGGVGGIMYRLPGSTNDIGSLKAWLMGNFSRFIRPGMYRLDLKRSDNAKPQDTQNGLMVSAYKDTEDKKVVVVCVNYSSKPKVIKLECDNLAKGMSVKSWIPYVTNRSSDLSPFKAVNYGSNILVRGRSVITLVSN